MILSLPHHGFLWGHFTFIIANWITFFLPDSFDLKFWKTVRIHFLHLFFFITQKIKWNEFHLEKFSFPPPPHVLKGGTLFKGRLNLILNPWKRCFEGGFSHPNIIFDVSLINFLHPRRCSIRWQTFEVSRLGWGGGELRRRVLFFLIDRNVSKVSSKLRRPSLSNPFASRSLNYSDVNTSFKMSEVKTRQAVGFCTGIVTSEQRRNR